MAKHKTWREKLLSDNPASGRLPRVVKLNDKQQKFFKAKTLAIPAPLEIDALMKKIPKGKLTIINDMRGVIAKRHKADAGCPITTGIFAWIASHAAEEERDAGKRRITPYWRTLKNGGELNTKYPGGIKEQAAQLKAEGFKIRTKGKRAFVEDYEKYLVKM